LRHRPRRLWLRSLDRRLYGRTVLLLRALLLAILALLLLLILALFAGLTAIFAALFTVLRLSQRRCEHRGLSGQQGQGHDPDHQFLHRISSF
jgi:cobalamin biosynthesis protein CobD/CbiB